MNDYISRQEVFDIIESLNWYHLNNNEWVEGGTPEMEFFIRLKDIRAALESIPIANVATIDEGIKMGIGLAAMHRSDATSKDLEEAYFEGLEEGMRRRDVRPALYGKWTLNKDGSGKCSRCGQIQYNCWDLDNWDNFCHSCGADMRGEVDEEW